MIELGNNCKIFTDNVEDSALQQIYNIAFSEEFKNTQIRIMPDVHAGSGICIGLTAPVKDFIDPEHTGVDIGCSVSAMFLNKILSPDNYELFEYRIKKEIPTGPNVYETSQVKSSEFLKYLNKNMRDLYSKSGNSIKYVQFTSENELEKWLERLHMDLGRFWKSLGTLGGGNHFMELDITDESEPKSAFIVHTGSRNLGQAVFKYWDKIAKSGHISKDDKRKIIADVKARVTDKRKLKEEIDKAVQEYELSIHPGFLTGDNMTDYLTDVAICQTYASYNHKIILDKVEKIFNKITGGKRVDLITTRHNYIDFESFNPILRKGAVRSYEGEKFLLPFNMRDGIAVCVGKSNPDWNFSCSHGAGRVMSRSKSKECLSMEEFRESMKGIYTTSVCEGTLDESPMSYKPKEEILMNIEPTAEVLFFMKPVINIKATEELPKPWMTTEN